MPRLPAHSWPALRSWLLAPGTHAWLLFAGVLVPQLLLLPPYAQDDLLRNVVAYAWHYDYRALDPAAPGLPAFDPYLGFDAGLPAVPAHCGDQLVWQVTMLGDAGIVFEAFATLRHLRVTALFPPHISKSIRCGISGMSAGGML